jgi:hypothetical protein
MVMKFVNFGVLAKVSKASKKLIAPLNPAGKARKNHHYVRVHHRRKSFHLAIEPNAVDRLDDCFYSLMSGCLH